MSRQRLRNAFADAEQPAKQAYVALQSWFAEELVRHVEGGGNP